MPQWGAFLFVIALLTVLLLVLARQSQGILHDQATTETTPAVESADKHLLAEESEQSHPEESEQSHSEESDQATVHTQAEDSDQIADQTLAEEPKETGIELTSAALLVNVAVTQAVVAVLVIVAAWYFGIPAEAFGVTTETLAAGLPGVVLGIALGIALWVANEFATTVADAVGASYDERVRQMLAPETTGGWVALFLLVLPIIAFAEELLFRAALIGVPAAGFEISPWMLAVISSLAFALGHGAQGRIGIVVTGLLGFVLAGAYILTASLLVVFVAHYVINALEFFIHEFLGVEYPFKRGLGIR